MFIFTIDQIEWIKKKRCFSIFGTSELYQNVLFNLVDDESFFGVAETSLNWIKMHKKNLN